MKNIEALGNEHRRPTQTTDVSRSIPGLIGSGSRLTSLRRNDFDGQVHIVSHRRATRRAGHMKKNGCFVSLSMTNPPVGVLPRFNGLLASFLNKVSSLSQGEKKKNRNAICAKGA